VARDLEPASIIEVVFVPDAGPGWRGPWRWLIAAAAAAAVVAALVAGVTILAAAPARRGPALRGPVLPKRSKSHQVHFAVPLTQLAQSPPTPAGRAGPAGVAAAYGYPLRCLTITFAAGDTDFARADFNHNSPCGRFHGYVTAIFHREGGAWRTVLDAADYQCAVAALPASVQVELGVCAIPSR
jgi:hypothetical protein